jgi:hypothetical protein
MAGCQCNLREGSVAGGGRKSLFFGGEGEIRTHEPREGPPVFKTGAINRSATSPGPRPAFYQGAVLTRISYLPTFYQAAEAV